MPATVDHWIRETDVLYFGRCNDGSVVVAVMEYGKPDDPNGNFAFAHQFLIDDGHWGSVVLNMTKFSERPNDWHEFMDHHHGRRDVLELGKEDKLKRLHEERQVREPSMSKPRDPDGPDLRVASSHNG